MTDGRALFRWNILLWVSLGVFALAVGIQMIGPEPRPKLNREQRLRQESQFVAETADWKRKESQAERTIEELSWTGGADAAEKGALALVTQISKSKGATLQAFRPQKRLEQGELTRLPFLVTLEGPYTKVLAVLRELETPSSKLAVNLVQIASADGASDVVTATLALFAFASKAPAQDAKAAPKQPSSNEREAGKDVNKNEGGASKQS